MGEFIGPPIGAITSNRYADGVKPPVMTLDAGAANAVQAAMCEDCACPRPDATKMLTTVGSTGNVEAGQSVSPAQAAGKQTRSEGTTAQGASPIAAEVFRSPTLVTGRTPDKQMPVTIKVRTAPQARPPRR